MATRSIYALALGIIDLKADEQCRSQTDNFIQIVAPDTHSKTKQNIPVQGKIARTKPLPRENLVSITFKKLHQGKDAH